MGISLYFQSCFIQLLSISINEYYTTIGEFEKITPFKKFRIMQDSHKYVGHLRSRETTNTARPIASHLCLIEIKSYSLKLSYWVVARNYVMSREFIPNQSCGCGVDAHIRDHYNQFIKCPAWPVRRVFPSLHSTYLRSGAQMFMCNIRGLDC